MRPGLDGVRCRTYHISCGRRRLQIEAPPSNCGRSGTARIQLDSCSFPRTRSFSRRFTHQGTSSPNWAREPGKRMKPEIVSPHRDESAQGLLGENCQQVPAMFMTCSDLQWPECTWSQIASPHSPRQCMPSRGAGQQRATLRQALKLRSADAF